MQFSLQVASPETFEYTLVLFKILQTVSGFALRFGGTTHNLGPKLWQHCVMRLPGIFKEQNVLFLTSCEDYSNSISNHYEINFLRP
jgi:hypothetical protein